MKVPPYNPNQPFNERRKIIEGLYQLFPPSPEERIVPPGTTPRPLTLGDLQQTAYQYSPVLREAWADVEEARGLAVQAGLYPNPELGYEGDTINTSATAGYNGLFFSQSFITAGKLDTARQSKLMHVRATEYVYRRTRYQVAAAVRRAFFKVLISRERVKFSRAISRMAQEVYQAQIELVAGGQAAPYEPLQLRVLALRARNDVIRAENAYQAAWRELAAAVAQPNMQPVELAGSVESPLPGVIYDAARSSLLARHTDLFAAQAEIASAGYNLGLQRVTPIPNVNVYGAVQHDATTSLDNISYNLQIGLPLPVFNRNQGNITAAQADLVHARNTLTTTQNRLIADLAEAYGRYATGRELAEQYQTDIVPSQVRNYRGVYEQFREVGGTVDFAQVVIAQQNLAETVNAYLDALFEAWEAAVDISELLQVDDMYTMDGLGTPAAGPDSIPLPEPAP